MTALSYAKLREAVCINGKMAEELRSGVASAIGIVTPSKDGNVLVPWHAVRWAVEAEAAPPTEEELAAAAKTREELAEAYERYAADMSVPGVVAPEPTKAKRKR